MMLVKLKSRITYGSAAPHSVYSFSAKCKALQQVTESVLEKISPNPYRPNGSGGKFALQIRLYAVAGLPLFVCLALFRFHFFSPERVGRIIPAICVYRGPSGAAGRRSPPDAGDCGVYRKKLFHRTPFLRSILPLSPVSMMKRGIYRKIFCRYPAYRKKVALNGHFFCIYPVLLGKGRFYQLQRPCAGYWRVIFPSIPRSPFGSESFICAWACRY